MMNIQVSDSLCDGSESKVNPSMRFSLELYVIAVKALVHRI